jgi:peptidoglycan/LPS O-acetylase OafA/YrhL
MSKHLHYLPKLDALRGLAALMVVCAHYFVDIGGPDFGYGGNGVQIFFVISGFLITTILLSQKKDARLSPLLLIRNFVTKRALRLFPVYYIFITFLFAVSIAGGLWICDKGDVWHYFTYTQNFLFFFEGFQSPLANHTWSLAVEEQFYLVWPFIILFTPRRMELGVLIAVYLVGVVSRIYFTDYYPLTGTVKGMPIVHFDSLGSGAILAWVMFNAKTVITGVLDKAADALFIVGLTGSALITYFQVEDSFFLPTCLIFMSVGLIYICTNTKRSIMNPVLNLRVLQSIGKISYGVYLFHKCVPFFYNYVCKKLSVPVPDNKVVLFLIYCTITIVISALSWKFLESRILKLKDRFDV